MNATPLKFSWKTFGHASQKDYVKNVLESDKISHGYLIAGPTQVGKTTFAKDFARLLLDNNSNLETNPDYYEVDKEEEIKIDDIRALISRFSLSSLSNGKKVALIANAHLANMESLNALLKILEEPKGRAVFILTATHAGLMPQTITSRLQTITCGRCSAEEIEKALKMADVPKKTVKEILKLSQSRMGEALRLANDEDYRELVIADEETLQQFLQGNLLERLNLAEALSGKESVEIKNTFSRWIISLEENFIKKESFLAAKLLRALENALSLLKRNANRKLVLDELCISL